MPTPEAPITTSFIVIGIMDGHGKRNDGGTQPLWHCHVTRTANHRLVTRQQDQVEEMSSTAGLSRRRVGGYSSSGTTADDDASSISMNGGSRTNSPPLPASTSHQGSGLSWPLGCLTLTQADAVGSVIQHAGSAFEGGSKVAFDPRDLAQDAGEEARIGGKMPRLTIMEEVLLLGIKDKQVQFPSFP